MGVAVGILRGIGRGIATGINPRLGLPAPVVTITTAPSDPSDDPTPTFEWTCSEVGCTYEYRIDGGAWTACVTPLTLGALADDTYLFEVRAEDPQGNVGAADSHSWTLATAYAGTLPSTVAELNGWTLASPWTILYNFDSATVGPSAVTVSSGSEAHTLSKAGSSADATKTADGQSGYADQSGYTVNTNQDFFSGAASALWKFSATVPTCYLITVKFAGTPSDNQVVCSGYDGANGGWYIDCTSGTGIRANIGSGSGYVSTSAIGGTSLYDGEYHTIMLVIDDAAGKAKLYTEFANTESTGLTITSGNATATIGPTSAGGIWGTAVTYLVAARGEHPLLYTNAQSLFDEYEDARLNNVNQTAIAGLPTNISDINSVTGLTFDYAHNIGSNAPSPMTGSSGSALAADTSVLHSAANGTTPTSDTAPKVRTSFTSQGSALFDSGYDNFAVPDLPESGTQSVIMLIWKAENAAATTALITRGEGPDVGWYARVGSSDQLAVRVRLSTASSSTYLAASQALGGWTISMLKFHGSGGSGDQLLHSATAGAAEVTSTTTATLGSNSTSNTGYIGASKPTNGYTAPAVDASHSLEVALVAWKSNPDPLPDAAALTAAIAATRWRYGI